MTNEDKHRVYMKLTKVELVSMLIEVCNVVEKMRQNIGEDDLWEFDESESNNIIAKAEEK